MALMLPAWLLAHANPDTVELRKIGKNVWTHTTYKLIGDYYFPANGLVVETGQGLILIDTPYTDAQTEKLLEKLGQIFGKPLLQAIVTHAHDDRMGGIAVLQTKNIPVASHLFTVQQARLRGYPEPAGMAFKDTVISIDRVRINLFFPGPGHTPDNIVVGLPDADILFGGCLVKNKLATNLGYTKDADLEHWPKALEGLLKKYPSDWVVIPGHGEAGDKELIRHTLKLLKSHPVLGQPRDEVTIKGMVYDPEKQTQSFRLVVVNQRTNHGFFGDSFGQFEVKARLSDTLLVGAIGFHTVKISLNDSVYQPGYRMKIPLKALQYNLEGVEVVLKKTHDESFQEAQKLGYDPSDHMLSGVDAFYSPLTYLYQLLSKKEKEKRLVAQLENDDARKAILKDLLKAYVAGNVMDLEEEEFDDFIGYCQITDRHLKTLSQYEFALYMKHLYQSYQRSR